MNSYLLLVKISMKCSSVSLFYCCSKGYATGGMIIHLRGDAPAHIPWDAFRYCAMSKDCATKFKGVRDDQETS